MSVESMGERLPIITIGGFLGAGKTTLVNQILLQADGKRIVVFVNDFGDINIDHTLVETVEADRISLQNGCVCCSLNDDLVGSIADFSREKNPPDIIVIEASGVADPRALDSSINALESAGLTRLDSRLYLLDAERFSSLAFEDAEQIIDHAVASDLILLNKSDIASTKQIDDIKNIFCEAAPYTKIVETEYSDISIDLIIGCQLQNKKVNRYQTPFQKKVDHKKQYRHWSGETKALIDRHYFEQFIKTLPDVCLRAKGLLRFSDAPEKLFKFDLVGYRATLERYKASEEQLVSQLVVIGDQKNLKPADIERGFQRTIVA